jgi:hypothetical protein
MRAVRHYAHVLPSALFTATDSHGAVWPVADQPEPAHTRWVTAGSGNRRRERAMWWMWIVGIVALIVAVVVIENRRGSKGAGKEWDEHQGGPDIRGGGPHEGF